MNRKTVILLVGPKGSGKTHVGSLAASYTDMVFLRVEPLWLSLRSGEEGWSRVETEVDRVLRAADTVVLESLGGSEGFERLRGNLAGKYILKLVRIRADLDTCFQRVKNRGSGDHIPISDDQVHKYNALADLIELDWDAELDNNGPASREEILRVLEGL